ncbi:predicted protein [Uncinocarpus reesii 1704]|uniref:Cyanovirin-N domain-containing protein n=1 Tax=Uncinocarpus reesii (strain UAMH 1704) TaxID=336963 RepID=C4JQD3_UNCRE|nr:uncharacterized protein UREG_04687 [Uncinocarpus reesii 1704]EEP79841.1 predicted protein [Uncinocarpus reesii 1704]
MKLSLLVLASLGSLASASFAKTCVDIHLFHWYLGARCRVGGEPGTRQTSIDLNYCFMNDNGRIVPKSRGFFWNSCKGCTLRPGAKLLCKCRQRNGKWMFNENDLTYISNNYGRLQCGDQRGKFSLEGSDDYGTLLNNGTVLNNGTMANNATNVTSGH